MDKDVVTVYPSAGHGNIRWKNLAKVSVFLLVFVLIFIWLQDIMTPNRDLPDTTVRFKKSVRGLLQEEKNTIDALWLGTSHVYSGIIPMELYRASGLRSHLLSGSSQRVPVAYYLLKNAFKEQSPSFVFIDASSFFIRKNEQLSYWQTAIDALPFSDMDIRIEMAAEAAGLNESAFDDDYIAMSVLPLLQYHTHVDLQEKDFYDLHLEQVYYRKGYVMNTRMSPVDKDDYDAIKAKLAQQPGSAEYTEEKIALEQEAQGNLGYIKDMVRLCRENGSQLIFIKVPTYITSSKYGGYWSRTKHDIVQELADEYQVTFLDLNYENVGLNWQTEKKDGGKHLNLYGATKVTDFLSDGIVHTLDVPVNDDA
ncbi:MAG: hypothetical protein IJH38_00200, partial [Clostridia bacterium]|nr:hypothetical protein [Clostridia bacterium]